MIMDTLGIDIDRLWIDGGIWGGGGEMQGKEIMGINTWEE